MFSDLLCRELPVVRKSDVTEFAVPSSQVGHRKTSSCTQCHATIDRMAGVIRNFSYHFAHSFRSTASGYFVDWHPTQKPPLGGWPSIEDPEYHLRPTDGVVYYRDWNGQLVNIPVKSVQEIGNSLVNRDDPYLCAASRYYQHFLGFKVTIEDPFNYQRSPQEEKHFQIVRTLAKNLKQHQRLDKMVVEILALPQYRQQDFGRKLMQGDL